MLKWGGTMLFGVLVAGVLTAIEVMEGTLTVPHVARDYVLVILAMYLLHLWGAAWRLHNELALCCENIWLLKQKMRDIRRRWPTCSFVQAPTNRTQWSPFIGQPETGMSGTELEKAIEWHDRLKEVCGGAPMPLLDWDGTMKFLDELERKRRSLPI